MSHWVQLTLGLGCGRSFETITALWPVNQVNVLARHCLGADYAGCTVLCGLYTL